jgi:hypothetical protein
MAAILREVQRVAGGDPRVAITDVNLFPQENGVLIELEVQFVPNTDSQLLSVFFDQQQRRASFV